MSLLIKALNKAEEAQAQNAKTEAQAQSDKTQQPQNAKAEAAAERVEFERASAEQKPATAIENTVDPPLSLSPATKISAAPNVIDEPSLVDALLADAGVVKSGATLGASPKNAANVFTAKGGALGNGNKNLAIIAGLALFALLGMGAYFVQFIDNTPEMPIPARTLASQPTVAQPIATPTALDTLIAAAPIQPVPAPIANNPIVEPTQPSAKVPEETTMFEPRRLKQKQLAETLIIEARTTSQKRTTKKYAPVAEYADDETLANAENAVEPENGAEVNMNDAPIIASKKMGKAKVGKLNKNIASDSASINVTKSQTQSGVNPTLMSAYEAYIAGKDSEAQKLYKQVLQRDVHSVDALLGMGAIAQRQGRANDANGWYGKVLEVEPRNNIARAALMDNLPQGNEQNNESHLKNMLAKQPDDANLHAALGNLYAEQNQWPAAQQAYFDAFRLHASADNAFNLAVSLDHMGKSTLALPYYQRALTLAQAGSNGIDIAALEARIAAIQSPFNKQ